MVISLAEIVSGNLSQKRASFILYYYYYYARKEGGGRLLHASGEP